MEVLGVLVQNKATEFLHGELASRPDLSDIEGVKTELVWIGLIRFHDLDHGSPLNLLALLDSLPEVALRVVGVLTAHLCGLLLCELLLAVLGDEVVFDIDEPALSVDPLEGVATIAVVKAPSYGSSVVTEEHETSMITLRCACKQVKDTVVVEQEVLGVAVLGSNDVGARNGVSAEKDGLLLSAGNTTLDAGGLRSSNQRYHSCPIMVNSCSVVELLHTHLHCVELDGETTRVTGLIREFASGRDSGESNEDWGLLANT